MDKLINEVTRASLVARCGNPSPEVSEIALWLAAQYESATHPVYPDRMAEYRLTKSVAMRYGIELSEFDFDYAMAYRFGGGCELEWR